MAATTTVAGTRIDGNTGRAQTRHQQADAADKAREAGIMGQIERDVRGAGDTPITDAVRDGRGDYLAAGVRWKPETHLTIEQAVSILSRSERGRAVGKQLYDFLNDKAISLDMDGKVAVLALIEECFINRPGSVLGALDDAFRSLQI